MKNDSIPMIFDGDSYELEVVEASPRCVLLTSVLRYTGNQNIQPVAENVATLAQSVRRAIVKQIHKKYPGRVIQFEI